MNPQLLLISKLHCFSGLWQSISLKFCFFLASALSWHFLPYCKDKTVVLPDSTGVSHCYIYGLADYA